MLLEEVTSREAREIRRKQSNPAILGAPNSSASDSESESEPAPEPESLTSDSDADAAPPSNGPKNKTTSLEDFDDSTSDLIKSSVSVAPENDEDYEATTAPGNANEPETATSSRPMLLSEFANHLAGGIRGKTETTTQPLPDFPTPRPSVFSSPPDDETFPFMVTAAKDFIRRYLSPEQWRKLRILLKTIREVGGSRVDIHRAATSYISRVISKTEMSEITERKNELFQTFNRRYFDKIPPR